MTLLTIERIDDFLDRLFCFEELLRTTDAQNLTVDDEKFFTVELRQEAENLIFEVNHMINTELYSKFIFGGGSVDQFCEESDEVYSCWLPDTGEEKFKAMELRRSLVETLICFDSARCELWLIKKNILGI